MLRTAHLKFPVFIFGVSLLLSVGARAESEGKVPPLLDKTIGEGIVEKIKICMAKEDELKLMDEKAQGRHNSEECRRFRAQIERVQELVPGPRPIDDKILNNGNETDWEKIMTKDKETNR